MTNRFKSLKPPKRLRGLSIRIPLSKAGIRRKLKSIRHPIQAIKFKFWDAYEKTTGISR